MLGAVRHMLLPMIRKPYSARSRVLIAARCTRSVATYAMQADGRTMATLSTPRHPLGSSLPELRACFVEQPPCRISERFGRQFDDELVYRTLFERLHNDALGDLTAYHAAERLVPTASDWWAEFYAPVDVDDTLLLGLRADVKYDRVCDGVFEHRYIAWSKAKGKVVAQGGAQIGCQGDGGEPAAIPPEWVYRMEVDYGDAWASLKILEFRREAGLGSHLGSAGIEDDLR
jgi:hypothetical protein